MRTFLAALTAFSAGIVAGTLTTLVYTDCKLRDAAALHENQIREMIKREGTISPGTYSTMQMDAPFWHAWLVPKACPQR
jgi:uncharacterized protein YneF (UPF0154 family)